MLQSVVDDSGNKIEIGA